MSWPISNQHPEHGGSLCAYRRGRLHGQVRDDWRDVLLGPQGLRLEEWLAAGFARPVKQGANRTVYRVEVPHCPAFYVKHYRPRTWSDAARALARGSLAHYEWKKTSEVLRRGIPTTMPLAWGEERRPGARGDSYLVTRAIEETSSLGALLESLPSRPPGEAARLRRDLLEALAALVAGCHAAGVRQPDLHTGNVLVQMPASVACRPDDRQTDNGPNGRLRLYLIDVPAVRFSGPLDWARSCQNLGVLCAVLRRFSTMQERRRFWRRYLAARPELTVRDQRRALAEIVRYARAADQRVARSRDRRCWRNNGDYQRLDTPHGRIYASSDVPPRQLAALAADPEGPLRAARHGAVKLSHASVVVQAELPTAAGLVRVAYKRARRKSWWKESLHWLRRPRVLTGWRLAHALRLRGIATARPLAAYQSRRGDGYLATEWLAGAENLHLHGWRLAKLSAAERSARARRCLQRLGELIGTMHAWDVSHRDLKAGNLAVVDRSDGAAAAEVAVYLLDLDGVRLRRRLSYAARVRNLARLAVSLELHSWVARPLILRFVLAYVRWCGEPRLAWKPLWRDVARTSRRIIAQHRRRGRLAA